jgi:hypothetical protein
MDLYIRYESFKKRTKKYVLNSADSVRFCATK